jgi:hypothetical protein
MRRKKAGITPPKVALARPASLAPARRHATPGDTAAAAADNKLMTREKL